MEAETRERVIRGCGERVAGGTYSTCGLSHGIGTPVGATLIDPPMRIDDETAMSLGLMDASGRVLARGVRLIKDAGGRIDAQGNPVYHVWDVVGGDYKNVADYIMEAFEHGFSRRLEGIDYSKIGPQSMHVLLHERAIITNIEYIESVIWGSAPNSHKPEGWTCPKYPPVDGHQDENVAPVVRRNGIVTEHNSQCSRYYWFCFDPKDLDENEMRAFPPNAPPQYQIHYKAWPDPNHTTQYGLGIFCAFPIRSLEVVASPDGEHERAIERAAHSSVNVTLVNQ